MTGLPKSIPEIQIRGEYGGAVEFVLVERLGHTHAERDVKVLETWHATVFSSEFSITRHATALMTTTGAEQVIDRRERRSPCCGYGDRETTTSASQRTLDEAEDIYEEEV